jgi:hypothetical protein
MSRSLKQDICGQGAPGTPVTDIERSQVERSLPPEVQYACLYWVQHLQKSGAQLREDDQVYQFLQVHLLHWLEALSWMRKISEGIYAILSVESIALVSQFPANDVYSTDLSSRHVTVSVYPHLSTTQSDSPYTTDR